MSPRLASPHYAPARLAARLLLAIAVLATLLPVSAPRAALAAEAAPAAPAPQRVAPSPAPEPGAPVAAAPASPLGAFADVLSAASRGLEPLRAIGNQPAPTSGIAPPPAAVTPTFNVNQLVGSVRVFAESADYENNLFFTYGVAGLSAGASATPLYYCQKISWAMSGPITCQGWVTTAAGTRLITGDSTVDRATGALTPGAGATLAPLTVGSSSLPLNGTFTVNVTQPQVPVNGAATVDLPENAPFNVNLQYSLSALDNSISGGSCAIGGQSDCAVTLALAGAALQATLGLTAFGLGAQQATLTLPDLQADLALADLRLDGPAGIRFGAAADFPLPDLDLGGGALLLRGARAQVVAEADKLKLAFTSGTVALPKLPENGSAAISIDSLTYAAGAFAGAFDDATLTVAGLGLKLTAPLIERAGGSYRLRAAAAALSLPAAWSDGLIAPTVDLTDVKLTTAAPFLDIGGGGLSFTTPKRFTLGGSSTTAAEINFDQVSGSLAAQASKWTLALSSDVTFQFGASGRDNAAAQNVAFVVDGGQASASVGAVTLKIAGLDLDVTGLGYQGDSFSASAATLTLPDDWDGLALSVSGLTIDKAGLKLGGASGTFAIPDRKLGEDLTLSGMSAGLEIDPADDEYQIRVDATVEIGSVQDTAGADGAEATGELVIDVGGVSGSVADFAFSLSGLTFKAYDIYFKTDTLHVGAAAVELPASMGGSPTVGEPQCPPTGAGAAGAVVCTLVISGDAVSLGGAQIKLPDFTAGGVGVTNAVAYLDEDSAGDYFIGGSGSFSFEKFEVEGEFAFEYVAATSSLKLQGAGFSFTGAVPEPSIPLGTTGFLLTGVSGKVDLSDGSTVISLGIAASSELMVGTSPLLGLDGTVTLRVSPFQLKTNANASLLGYQLASVDLTVTDSAFALDAQLSRGILTASLSLTFGKATVEECATTAGVYSCQSADEFTFVGQAAASITIPRGYILDKWYAPAIPPADIVLSADLEAGKFRNATGEVWGGQGTVDVLGFDVDAYAILSPSLSAGPGAGLSEYQPVLPAAQLQAAAPGTHVRQVAIPEPARYLMFAEAITATNRAAAPLLEITAPDGSSVTPQLTYTHPDGSVRLYRVNPATPEAAVGRWTLTYREGNLVRVKAAHARPQVESVSACVGASCVGAGAPLSLAAGTSVAVAWDTRAYRDGLSLQIFAEGADGRRHTVVHQHYNTGRELKGSRNWMPAMASGTYTLTLLLDGHDTAPVRVSLGRIAYTDSAAPAAVAGLQAAPLAGRGVELTWGGGAEGDIAGYRVAVDGGAPRVIARRTDRTLLHGLNPGRAHTLTVAAYDLSGNVGPAASVQVTLPSFTAGALWPPRDHRARSVGEVGFTFTGPATGVGLTVVDAAGNAVPGAVRQISHLRRDGGRATFGAVFVPTGGRLAPGRYTATLSGQPPLGLTAAAGAGQAAQASWSFTVLSEPTKPSEPIKLYLPLLRVR